VADPPLIYLDHAATTPMRPEAVAAMMPFLSDRFANPSGSHRASRNARLALDEARDVVAECLGVKPGGIVFTGCGTEADNTAILGVVRARGGIAVCPSTEHHAVLHPVEHTGGRVVPVDGNGVVRLDDLAEAVTDDVTVVSVMAANNEVGTVQPLAEISRLVRRQAPKAVLHTDAVQAACWLDLAALTPLVDMLSLSGHKFGGPKGVGVLWVREGVAFEPLLLGGGQERDRRSGTHNVAGIVAFAEALRLATVERAAGNARITTLRDRLVDGLLALSPCVVETVPRAVKIPGSAHVLFTGCESESLLFLLDQQGICASAASACASGAMEPSHVLSAMGVPRERARGAIRFSLGVTTTDDDIDHVLAVVPALLDRLLAAPTRAMGR
jgi:cysteine desulfurase